MTTISRAVTAVLVFAAIGVSCAASSTPKDDGSDEATCWGCLLLQLALLAVLTVAAFAQFRTVEKMNGVYSKTDFLYYPKYAAVRILLSFVRWRQKRRIWDFSPRAKYLERWGFVASESEKRLEMPKELHGNKWREELSFTGFGSKGEFVRLCMERRNDGTTTCDIVLQSSDGRKFHLPGYPKGTSYVTSAGKFQAGGLRFEDQEPMKRWRISFCGTLKEMPTPGKPDSKTRLVFAKFRFVWGALSRPFDYSEDRSPSLIADGFAREPWSVDFLQLLGTRMDDGYEQWGMLQGEVSFPGEDPMRMVLRGPRIHAWERRTTRLSFHRSVATSIFMDDGTMLRLHGTSDALGLTETWDKSYLIQTSLWLRPLNSLELTLAEFGEAAVPTTGQTFDIRCKAGPQSLQVRLTVCEEVSSGITDFPEESTVSVLRLDCEAGGKRGQGIAVFSYRDPNPTSSPAREVLSTVRKQHALPDWAIPDHQRGLCVPFSSPACTSATFVGGKGASLAVLDRLRSDLMSEGSEVIYEVSNGFCVTVKAYECQVEYAPGLKEALGELERLPTDEMSLQDLCLRAQRAFEDFDVAPGIVGSIVSSLLEAFGSNWSEKSFALRSSAVGEDSDEASSAGQNETFLGVIGLDEILTSLRACWASQFSPRSIQYRRQNGVPLLTPMAVVVQEMVRADAAGVLFTCDPVTGDPSYLHISSNIGLGETVVSGEAEPDTIVLKRDESTGAIAVESVDLGQKGAQMRIDENGKVVKSEAPEDSENTPSISDSEALRLARVGVLIEDAMGGFRDIEWALCQGKLYLLQSRPVTTIHGVTDFELMHEFDSAILCEDEYSTRGNTGEVLPGAITPLTMTTTSKTLELTMQQLSTEISRLTMRTSTGFCPDNRHLFRLMFVSHSVALLNFVELFMREHQGHELEPDKVAHCIGTFGRAFEELEAIQKVGDERYKPLNALQAFLRTFWFLKGMWGAGGVAKKALELSEATDYSTEEDLSPEAIARTLEKVCDVTTEVGMMHILVSGMSLFAEVMMVLALNGKKKEVRMTPEQMGDIALLLGMHQDGVISREVPETFKDLADLIRGTSKQEEFLQLSPIKAHEWLSVQQGQLGYRYKEFFKRHGHRGLKEFELRCKPWGMTPELVAETLQNSVRIPVDFEKSGKRHAPTTSEEVVNSLKSEISGGTKRFLKFLVNLGARGVKQREMTKSALISLTHKFRLELVKIRKFLVTRGRIPDEDLAFFVTLYEILQLIRRPCPAIVQRALKRRRIYPTLDALEFPEVCKGVPSPISPEDDMPEFDSTSLRLEVRGTPVCHGLVKGPIRVINSLEHAKEIVPGDILVTHSTDIGWSPYFPILGGLVTEIGGLISHGAVVAREYGLPCVVGVKNATKLFKSGGMGILDGSKGTLALISDSATAE